MSNIDLVDRVKKGSAEVLSRLGYPSASLLVLTNKHIFIQKILRNLLKTELTPEYRVLVEGYLDCAEQLEI